MTHDVPPEREDEARALFGDLIAGLWEKAHREFDLTMRRHADAQRIARGWTHVADPVGNFERMGALSASQAGDYTGLDVPLTFRAGEAIVVLNRDGRVAGLSGYPITRWAGPCAKLCGAGKSSTR